LNWWNRHALQRESIRALKAFPVRMGKENVCRHANVPARSTGMILGNGTESMYRSFSYAACGMAPFRPTTQVCP
jgi:hypothetical protein